ncbi:MarR family transcriptional regulator [Gilliamella sp. B14448G11]|uniref:MarR family winged helix-turn-helix transcriptional regulator n=1 Tax=unclassified Gilliamella TaxID=2685620 RepID=UPI0018DB58F3|nr:MULTISPECIES: MarR family transcriptional regulator [unclassified Gilliamella]MBI0028182.1 MarR family transcriptional regulator [Gilliamella sp. B14448G7]MBI0034585.1 MarR family transcriptional regulator [Gilliamella sp. B14448G11]MBI0042081.1 MarR family transcriptional regulator [Gilliamella sp. B14448G12]
MQLENRYLSFCNILKKENTINLEKIRTCFTLLSVSNLIDIECSKRLQQFDLSESRLIILVLLQEYQELSLQEIAKKLGITKASTTTLISSLVNKQLISKKNDKKDKRITLVSLTSAGTVLLTETLKQHSLWIEKITNNLSDNDVAIFKKVLSQIYENVLTKDLT